MTPRRLRQSKPMLRTILQSLAFANKHSAKKADWIYSLQMYMASILTSQTPVTWRVLSTQAGIATVRQLDQTSGETFTNTMRVNALSYVPGFCAVGDWHELPG